MSRRDEALGEKCNSHRGNKDEVLRASFMFRRDAGYNDDGDGVRIAKENQHAKCDSCQGELK